MRGGEGSADNSSREIKKWSLNSEKGPLGLATTKSDDAATIYKYAPLWHPARHCFYPNVEQDFSLLSNSKLNLYKGKENSRYGSYLDPGFEPLISH